MAMTAQVKAELATVKVTRPSCRKAESRCHHCGSAGGLHIVSGRIVIEAELDTGAAARRLRTDIADVFGHTSELVIVSGSGSAPGDALRRPGDQGRFESLARQTGLVDGRGRPARGLPAQVVSGGLGDCVAAWRGAFLAHGSLTEPGRSMALEVTCPGPEAALGPGRCGAAAGHRRQGP